MSNLVVMAQMPYRLFLAVGFLGALASFFLWIFATSAVPPPSGVWLFYGSAIPFILFFIIGYLCPIRICCDDKAIEIKTMLLSRNIPWDKILKVSFRNVLDDRGKIETDHPSYLIVKTDHLIYRWYFVSRFFTNYEELVKLFIENGKLRKDER